MSHFVFPPSFVGKCEFHILPYSIVTVLCCSVVLWLSGDPATRLLSLSQP